MRLNFKFVDKENIEEILNLRVRESQKNQIEPVAQCLSEAKAMACWKTVGIYDEDIPIGFAMYGFWEGEGDLGRLWFDRFFIDERFQGKGYARKALELIIKKISCEYREYKVKEIFLSVTDKGIPAVKLYEELGFSFNGETDEKGEKIMNYKIN